MDQRARELIWSVTVVGGQDSGEVAVIIFGRSGFRENGEKKRPSGMSAFKNALYEQLGRALHR